MWFDASQILATAFNQTRVTWSHSQTINCTHKRECLFHYISYIYSPYFHALFVKREKNMGKTLWSFVVFTCLLIPLAVADWNILKLQTQDGLKISLKNYCESWRMNAELHNIRDFQVVPEECTEYIGKYVKSTQYKVDSQRASEECLVYLSTSCNLKKDGLDAWIFDIDDTLLSTVPYYKNNLYG